MSSDMKMFTVDKFLGVQESGDGDTELQMGMASKMENFFVTDDWNLKLRPGLVRFPIGENREPGQILDVWAGAVGGSEMLIVCDFYGGTDRIFCVENKEDGETVYGRQEGVLGLTDAENAYVSIFDFGGDIYIMSAGNIAVYENGVFVAKEAYVPLVIAGAAPAGGGTTMEPINRLTRLRRITYSADGTSTAYVLPPEAVEVTGVSIDGMDYAVGAMGSFSAENQTFTFLQAPVKGVGNVEITYGADPVASAKSRMEIIRCRLHESYNGSTDTRLFAAGNGTNMCYYTGPTMSGEATALYFPALNEVKVDMSASEITGMNRHYSKLMIFKQDEVFTISYEAVTLTDGTTTAGFYLRPMNNEFGNNAIGQVQTVNNYPRSLCKGGVYEWRVTSSYYKDERYAVRVSDNVGRTLQEADLIKAVTCDDGIQKTYYVFLNDSEGTVLVNRYDMGKEGVWCIYKGKGFRNVRRCVLFGQTVVLFHDTGAFSLAENVHVDAAEDPTGEPEPIPAVWESGNMSFGADFRRKYSSYIYLNLKPMAATNVTVTAETDRRGDYLEKNVKLDVFDWANVNFRAWCFNTNSRPSIHRVRLKVKKFVYYKLILKIEEPGATGTILGFDQQVRYASMAK